MPRSGGLLLLSVYAVLSVAPGLGQHVVQDTSGKGARRLQQSTLQLNPQDPVSATALDLASGDDPTGRGHLLVRVCNHL